MSTYFISDLHLNASEPEITKLFSAFCQNLKTSDTLYILGDFFNAWIGDDACSDYDKQIMAQLSALTQKSIDTYLLYGNRDFLMGSSFFNKTGIKQLEDQTLITIEGKKILLMHGDTLCTEDKKYLRYRQWVRNPYVQKLFLRLPKKIRLKIAAKLRAQSHQTFDRTKKLVDVSQTAVEAVMQAQPCDILIHGHTHAPGVHDFEINGKAVQRIVLGAWHNSAMIAKTVDENITLLQIP